MGLRTDRAQARPARQAKKFLAERERKVAQLFATTGAGPMTLQRYVLAWLDKRKTATVNDDRTWLERHVLPRIGDVLLTEVRPRHLRDLILELRAEGNLAPTTIRQISGLLHSMFKSAKIDELITDNPAVYERGVLPKKVDKDPAWRDEAIFTRVEAEQIISDPRMPADRRVLAALKLLAALRHGEAASLTWSQVAVRRSGEAARRSQPRKDEVGRAAGSQCTPRSGRSSQHGRRRAGRRRTAAPREQKT
jgi:integrase